MKLSAQGLAPSRCLANVGYSDVGTGSSYLLSSRVGKQVWVRRWLLQEVFRTRRPVLAKPLPLSLSVSRLLPADAIGLVCQDVAARGRGGA